ncbi:RtcB family protein [Desulfovibrio oxyclinae]|uniref:RtcB family protein n=1 Tax=Desulfovibrio oxyclinae TaxID=63560 RepID=UPI0003657403|nr:RtcB family protein [Desulfovibrio oxyclinae]
MKRHLVQKSPFEWELPIHGDMRVPGIIFASESILADMDEEVLKQVRDVACLPGIVRASMAMPDAHAGYGFPIGGVAAFDPQRGGVISMGGVGFDIACGVRTLLTGLTRDDILAHQEKLADTLFASVPAGVGRGGDIVLEGDELDEMLTRGATWAVQRGLGQKADLERIEDNGISRGANPSKVSKEAKKRIRNQIGSLGGGNHYLEVQYVEEILDAEKADIFGISEGDALVSIHCGSRGLGHQIGTDFLNAMAPTKSRKGKKSKSGAPKSKHPRQLAHAPIDSKEAQNYLAAMHCGINCALANRQVITHLVRKAFASVMPEATLPLLYDVSHNTCKVERHEGEHGTRKLFVHRKGATRAYPPGHPSLPEDIREAGQPVLIGGSMGSASYILAGTQEAMRKSFGSANHGAGRALSRTEAKRKFDGMDIGESLRHKGILVRSKSLKSVAEEAPDAYKKSSDVITSVTGAGLAAPVARLMPMICIKG